MQALEILLSDARGIYIPANFVSEFDVKEWGLDPDGWEVQTCDNPDNLLYWDAWMEILDKAEFHHEGKVWRLHQDGDLFAICYELMTDEEKEGFGFNE